jgi:hypothetical protein
LARNNQRHPHNATPANQPHFIESAAEATKQNWLSALGSPYPDGGKGRGGWGSKKMGEKKKKGEKE